MNLHRAVIVQREIGEDEDIFIRVLQLPVRQIQRLISRIADDDRLGGERPCADDADDLDGDIYVGAERGLGGRVNLRGRGRLHRGKSRLSVIAVVPEQNRAGHAGRNERIEEQVLDKSAAIHRV